MLPAHLSEHFIKSEGTMVWSSPRRAQFFLRLHGLWEGVVNLPRPPPPPFDIETMEPIEPPWQAIKEWIADAPIWQAAGKILLRILFFITRRLNAAGAFPTKNPISMGFNRPRNPSNPDPDGIDQSQTWQAPEIQLDDGRILVFEYT